jgi:membrane-associated phospholipid phosphatase
MRRHALAPTALAPVLALALAMPVALGAHYAHAQATPASGRGSAAPAPAVYQLRLSVDLPLMIGSALLGSSWLLRGELDAPCASGCDAARLPALDRPLAGRYDPTARTVSDVSVGIVLVGSSALLLSQGGFAELAIGAEAVLITSALAVVTMYAVRRPRPLAYGDDAPRAAQLEGNAALGFPSGHAANAFAATLATFHALHTRAPGSAAPWVALGVGLAASSAVGVSRVLAGDHFPSDVLVGAGLGAAVGWLVPELHRVAPRLSIGPGAGPSLTLSGSF